MKTNQWIGLAAAWLMAATTASADIFSDIGGWFSEHFQNETNSKSLFSRGELSLDIFGTIYSEDRHIPNGPSLDGQLGMGLGVNYFLTERLGVGAETAASNNGNSFFDYFAISGIYRFPLEKLRIAPYGFAGFAEQFDIRHEASGHLGAGVEYRLNPKTGVYVDGRYVWADQTNDYWLFRLGVRLLF
jgi:hypothetical protein